MKERTQEILGVVIPIAVLVIIPLSIFWAINSIRPKEITDHKFQVGQCVEMKLTNEAGMVISQMKYRKEYRVRIARASVRESAIFGTDNVENQRYALIYFREFELRDCQ